MINHENIILNSIESSGRIRIPTILLFDDHQVNVCSTQVSESFVRVRLVCIISLSDSLGWIIVSPGQNLFCADHGAWWPTHSIVLTFLRHFEDRFLPFNLVIVVFVASLLRIDLNPRWDPCNGGVTRTILSLPECYISMVKHLSTDTSPMHRLQIFPWLRWLLHCTIVSQKRQPFQYRYSLFI